MKLGAIFDMDGLLMDTEKLYRKCWNALIREYRLTPYPAFPIAVSGSNGEEQQAIIRRFYPEVDAVEFQHRCLSQVNEQIELHGADRKPGAMEILEFLHSKGVKTAVASSNSLERIQKNLQQADLWPLFDAAASGLEVVRNKPSPDVFLLAAERIGVPPEDCYVFEDSYNGIRAAAAAGCTPVMIPDLAPPTAEMRTLGAAVYSSLLEARDRIAEGAL